MTATNLTRDEVKAQATAVVGMVSALGEAVHDAGPMGLPEGPLYMAFMGQGIGLDGFTRMVDLLVGAGLVKRSGGHLLTWVGPPMTKKPQ